MSEFQAETRSEGPSGAAIACIILGCFAFVSSCILVGALFGVVGAILGVVHLRSRQTFHGLAWTGITLSVLGIVCSVGLGFVYFSAVKVAMESFKNMANRAASLDDWKGAVAPAITMKTLDGETIQLSDLKGKRVVLDFWATWCPSCVLEIPHFVELRKTIPDAELVIIGISEEEPDTIREFAKRNNVNYPMVASKDLPIPYRQVNSIPTTFFIDRNGVMQEIVTGYRDLDELKRLATAADYEGPLKTPPTSGLHEAEIPLSLVEAWTISVSGGMSLCLGDWDGDGQQDILVGDTIGIVHVIDVSGVEKTTARLPEYYQHIELGRHPSGPRLLAYSTWASSVKVFDRSAKKLWDYQTSLGIDGAHWGDLDGDGADEMVVGLNGFGGLHALTPEGKLLWKDSTLSNVWNQAIVSATASAESRVVVTEAGGSVNVFDAKGHRVRTLRPKGKYFSKVSAARERADGPIQILVTNDETLAMDENGTIDWSTPAQENPGNWVFIPFAWGDVEGDGALEWMFIDITGELVVVNSRGVKLAALKPRHFEGFAIISRPAMSGLVVTLAEGQLQALRVAEAPASEESKIMEEKPEDNKPQEVK